jgi:hypothetical protein
MKNFVVSGVTLLESVSIYLDWGRSKHMRHLLLAVMALLIATSAHAQSYDFTISTDPSFCTVQSCATRLGSGQFTISADSITELTQTLYPITSLTGTLDNLPISLSAIPGHTSSGFPGTNLFWTAQTPISPLAPLAIQSGSTNQWTISMTDFNHPGTGQTGYSYQTGIFTPVSFHVSLTPVPKSGPPISGPSNGPPPLIAQATKAFVQRQAQTNVELEILAPLAGAATVYLIHRHWSRHREALPAGRV